MGLQAVPGYIGQSGYNHPVELFRNLTKALTQSSTGLLGSSTGFAMTPSGAAMQLTVAAGFAVIAGVESNSQGSYFVWSDASEVLAWPAHAGSSRVDSLILRVIDTQYGTDPDTPQAEWEIVSGTPAGSPVAVPDIEFAVGGDNYRPGAWWRVADVLVQTTDTVMTATDITDYRQLAGTDKQRITAGALYLQTVKYTANGSFVKASYPNAKKVFVRAQAGGGGGGGAAATAAGNSSMGGGGGGGAYAEGWLDVSGLAGTVTVSVGAGGTGVAGNPGNSGGTSSFGTAVIANGGSGGSSVGAQTSSRGAVGGAGGTSSAGDVQTAGQAGENGWGDAGLSSGGAGGGSHLGGGAVGTRIGSATQATGIGGAVYGGGGSAACGGGGSVAAAGGTGAAGIVLVDVYV